MSPARRRQRGDGVLHAFALDHPLYVRVLRFLTDVAWVPMMLRLVVAAVVVVLLRRRAVRRPRGRRSR
ncbi:hypothetical protein [Streptomyces sp. NWU339]|uniref:hypothetical protein n=1 Tax=Streptomyces sp. NWU339 TaxID=2185284 RepID=UPI0011B6B625|nr:hypothetical protein [Streptomyces sp. NWU339]